MTGFALPSGVRAVAFDLDGTLLDTLPDIADAGNAMLAELGRAAVPESVVRSYIGDGIPRLTKRLLTGSREGEPETALYERALLAFQSHYYAGLNRRTRPYPGVVEGLRILADGGLPLACVTNKAERFTLPLLEAHGLLACFRVVVSGDTLPRKKPDPLPLLHCCREFGIQARQLLVLGDSANDVAAARAAGCPVVCVPYGYTGDKQVRDLEADAIVPGVLELSLALFAENRHPS